MIVETADIIPRPIISIRHGIIYHNSIKCRIVLSADMIFIGCTSITPEAAIYILSKWKDKFEQQKPKEIVLQEGVNNEY